MEIAIVHIWLPVKCDDVSLCQVFFLLYVFSGLLRTLADIQVSQMDLTIIPIMPQINKYLKSSCDTNQTFVKVILYKAFLLAVLQWVSLA